MFKVARRPYSIAFWFAAVLLGACGWQVATPTNEPPRELTDRSLLTGLPCEAPCWQGLILGLTTKAESLAVAQTLSFIDPVHFPERRDLFPLFIRQQWLAMSAGHSVTSAALKPQVCI